MKIFILSTITILIALVTLPPAYYALYPTTLGELPPAGRKITLANGVNINAVVKGTGPLVILVHGSPGSSYDWAPLSQALAARGRQVIAYDRVGYGYSDARIDDDFTMTSNGRDLIQLLERMEAHDVTVIGWSFGGGTAIQAAIMDPSRIARLVLIGSSGPTNEPEETPIIYTLLFSAPAMKWAAAVPPIARAARQALSVEAFNGQPMPDQWLAQLEGNFLAPHTALTYRREIAQYQPNVLDPSPINRPILVIHGDVDRILPLAIGEDLNRRAQDSELMIVKGGSHMLPITHAELLANRIVAFEDANRGKVYR